jgi:hypothetical protein
MATAPDKYADLHRVARRRGQRGYFTSAQAEACGLSRMQLSRLVEQGLMVRAAHRVYRFRVAAETSWKDRLAVELLSTGGVTCGLSSTALINLADPPARPQVLVARGGGAGIPGRHSTRELPAYECVRVEGLRTLAPVRAVLDSLHRLPRGKAIGMVESAIVRGLVKPEALLRRAKELTHSKRPGCAIASRILADLHPDVARARFDWVALVARRVKQFGLEEPQLEYELFFDGHRYIADAAWPQQRVALEFDGRDPHMRRAVHDSDTGRRNDFMDAGWSRFGITASALRNRDDRTFRQVARAIARG